MKFIEHLYYEIALMEAIDIHVEPLHTFCVILLIISCYNRNGLGNLGCSNGR